MCTPGAVIPNLLLWLSGHRLGSSALGFLTVDQHSVPSVHCTRPGKVDVEHVTFRGVFAIYPPVCYMWTLIIGRCRVTGTSHHGHGYKHTGGHCQTHAYSKIQSVAACAGICQCRMMPGHGIQSAAQARPASYGITEHQQPLSSLLSCTDDTARCAAILYLPAQLMLPAGVT